MRPHFAHAVAAVLVLMPAHLPLETLTVQPESRLEDLGVDSLAVAEVIVEVEIRLGCELPIDVLRRLSYVETIGDVARELGQFGLEA